MKFLECVDLDGAQQEIASFLTIQYHHISTLIFPPLPLIDDISVSFCCSRHLFIRVSSLLAVDLFQVLKIPVPILKFNFKLIDCLFPLSPHVPLSGSALGSRTLGRGFGFVS